jgi:hypothetical protein
MIENIFFEQELIVGDLFGFTLFALLLSLFKSDSLHLSFKCS